MTVFGFPICLTPGGLGGLRGGRRLTCPGPCPWRSSGPTGSSRGPGPPPPRKMGLRWGDSVAFRCSNYIQGSCHGPVAAIFSTIEAKYVDRGKNLQKLTAPYVAHVATRTPRLSRPGRNASPLRDEAATPAERLPAPRIHRALDANVCCHV